MAAPLRHRLALRLFAGVVTAVLGGSPAWASCSGTTWTLNASANWFGSGGWLPDADPNSSGTNVCIVDGSSTVTLNGTASTANLTLATGNTLSMGGNTLKVYGTSVSNAGAITIGDGNLTLFNNVTLSGGGTITISSDVFINQGSGGLTLTNADNTIQGTGQFGQNGLSIDNESAINASGGTLSLNGGGLITNTGTLAAISTGTLQVDNSVNNAGGNITADSGTVTFGSGTITGGTLNTQSGGMMNGGTAALAGVTVSSGSTFNVSGQTYLQGTITNNGTFTVPNTTLTIQGGDVTLQGGGTISMTSDAFFNQASGGLTLHNVNNLIEGSGQLGENGMALDNQASGVVNANLGSAALSLNGGGTVSNAGLLEATNGGILTISNTVNNTGNGAITANGGTVNLQSTINGGTLNVTGGGTMNASAATLNTLTLSAGGTLNDLDSVYLQGTITNNGTFTVPNTTLTIKGGDVTLQGGGTISMTSDAFFNQASGGLTLHNVDNLIEGSGQLGENGMALDNQASGVVNANIGSAALSLNGGGTVSNAGLLEATNGGILTINNTVNNTGNGAITANGGTVNLQSTINGGTLNVTGGGTMNASAATLNTLTLSAGSTLNDSNQVYLQGTINNQGTITLADTTLTILGSNVTLQGGGTISMTSDAFFNQASGGLTLTNIDNTIEGTGQLGENGMTIKNGGTILANETDGILNVNGGGSLTNTGTLKATNGGTLLVNNPFTNYSGGTLTGGTYVVNGTPSAHATIQINALGSGGGEIVNLGANTTLTLIGGNGAGTNYAFLVDSNGSNAVNLASNAGSLNIENGFSLVTQSGTSFTNSGNVLIDSLSGLTVSADDYIQTGGETQVDGDLSALLVNIEGGTLAGGNGVSAGHIFGDVENDGTLQAGDNLDLPVDPPGTLDINGDYTQLGGGSLNVDIAGILAGDTSLVNVTGNVDLAANAALDVDLLDGFDPTTSEEFLFMTYGGTLNSEAFDITDPDVDPNGVFTVDYTTTPGDIYLDFTANPGSPTPEPSTIFMFLGAVSLFAGARRLRRA